MRRRLVMVLVAVLAVLAPTSPAAAGGTWMESVRERNEAGGTATLVGYTGGPVGRGLDLSRTVQAFLVVGEERVPLGPLQVEDTGREGWERVRVSISFGIPAGLPPGRYEVGICGEPCSLWTAVGDIVGGIVYVGVDRPQHRPPSEPPPEPVPAASVVATTVAASGPAPAAPAAPAAPEPQAIGGRESGPSRALPTVVVAGVVGALVIVLRRLRGGRSRDVDLGDHALPAAQAHGEVLEHAGRAGPRL